MAFFLPSYFQKRLLRYAISRLDFVETDELDLENLGITWGQRSVIELKDVGIQIAKLAALLSIPSTILITRARIGLLRLTIPADLYSSGIVVEIGEVDVQVKVQNGNPQREPHHAQPRPGSGLSKGNRGDRPRKDSSAMHDPGGTRPRGLRHSTVGETGIPTSQNLALSFLESEPAEERRELQSIVQSQSRYLNESTSDIAGNGTGVPGGFELPTFVASFFKGVADRLSAAIKDVSLTVEIDLPQLGYDTINTVKLNLRVSEIELQGVRIGVDGLESEGGKRSVTVKDIQLVLLSEPNLVSQVQHGSANSSPRLSRSQPILAAASGRPMSDLAPITTSRPSTSQGHPSLPVAQSTLSQQSSESSESSAPAFASGLGLEPGNNHADVYHDLDMQDSVIMPNSRLLDSQGSLPGHSSVDNKTNAQCLARSGEYESSAAQYERSGQSSEDLAESRLFTHDEAESMYMSAVSHDFEQASAVRTMPGAWGWSEHGEQIATTPTGSTIRRDSMPPIRELPEDTRTVSQERPSDPTASGDAILTHPDADFSELAGDDIRRERPSVEEASLVAKQIFSISYITVSIPTERTHENALVENTEVLHPQPRVPLSPRHSKKASFADDSLYSQVSSQMFTSTRDLSQEESPQNKTRDFDHEAAQAQQSTAPMVDFGIVSMNLDLPIAKLLVRVWQEINPFFAPVKARNDTKSSDPTPLPFEGKAERIDINVCEEVGEFTYQSSASPFSKAAAFADEKALLQISFAKIKVHTSSDGINSLNRVTVHKITIGHKGMPILSFAEVANARSSVSASTLSMGDDIVLVVQQGAVSRQTEIQAKFIKLRLDLLQMDEVLSRSGGLSSLLDLGNSIVSTGTVRGETLPSKQSSVPRHSVRFKSTGVTQRVPDAVDSQGPGKINVRIAGVSVELAGSDSAMLVKTSAIKIVHRQSLFALQIDWTEVEGPLLKRQTSSDIKLRINNTRLEYLNSPKEEDLERLLSILAPSSNKHELEKDDDIMVDTLIRQRRKGGVLRLTLYSIESTVLGLRWQKHLLKLGDELSRLSSVSKYLPEDDRPGMLTLALVKKTEFKLVLDPNIGTFSMKADLIEAAHVNVPSLLAAHVTTLEVLRNQDCIVGDVVSSAEPKLAMSPPMIMVRFIADEMEPTVRVKVFNLLFEYKVPTLVALLDLGNAMRSAADESRPLSPTSSVSSSSNAAITGSRNKTRITLAIRDSALGLNPVNSSAKGIVLLTQATFAYTAGKGGQVEASADLKKLAMLVCGNASSNNTLVRNADPKMFFDESLQVQELVAAGFVPIAFLSAALATITVTVSKPERQTISNVELENGLLILETCADSTQTMTQVLNGLSPPVQPSTADKYRTEIVPIQDMLASFTGNAYFAEPEADAGMQARSGIRQARDGHRLAASFEDLEDAEEVEEGEDEEAEFGSHLWQSQSEADVDDTMSESYVDSELAQSHISAPVPISPTSSAKNAMEASREDIIVHSMLDFKDDHFSRKEVVGGTAHRWDSKQNTYGMGGDGVVGQSPLKVKVRGVHVIWHLFDGYDWQSTRDHISKAVHDLETRAAARRPRSNSRLSPRLEEDDESVIGDFLFNSIYIGIPANRDPRELTTAINRDIDDMTSETGSYATSITVTATPTRRPSGSRRNQKRLRLERGKHHKMAFELKGIAADFILFPPGSSEVESSIDIRIQDLEIIDLLPTSTWRKFATYMQDAGEREVDTNMVHIEILNVKPVADLAASEIVLKLTVLPLRLHVDQDAIDFMTRFFEFKDNNAPVSSTPSTPPFLQRVEVNPIRLKLDFKPKRVDYGGLRSGRTTEFMNFFVLDRADMVLRRVILYGVSGFDRMGIMLNSIWSPDVRRNQLPGVLAGLAPIRSLVDVGSGVRDLVVVPMREYKKDGRIVRSIQKGALAFAKTTTKELVNLGAKLAIGTQTVLQDTERLLGQAQEQDRWEDQGEDEERKQISLYADQPLGIVQGLRGAYTSLERDLLLAKDAIVAVPGEVMATGSATGAAQAVLRSAPTIILRPAIGATKAVGQTLLGAGNTLDRDNYRRMQEKYKRH